LIGTIRSELGEAAFSRLLRRRAEGIAANYRRKLAPEPDIRGKLAALAELRTAEGYMARLEELPEGGYLLIEDHCPICAAAIACQGFCSAELEVFQELLGDEWRIERLDHLLGGARRCSYRITAPYPKISKGTDAGDDQND
jgi:predicted ArsR family transcriptional regulator